MLIKIRLKRCTSSIIRQAEGLGIWVGKTYPSSILIKVNISIAVVAVPEVVLIVLVSTA